VVDGGPCCDCKEEDAQNGDPEIGDPINLAILAEVIANQLIQDRGKEAEGDRAQQPWKRSIDLRPQDECNQEYMHEKGCFG